MSYQQQFLLLEKWLGVVYWLYLELLLILVSGFVCVFMFCVFIEDQEIILMMKASRRSHVGTSLTNQPWYAFFMHGGHVSWHTCRYA